MQANIDYLLTSFTVDHMLLPFRERAGDPDPPAGPRPQVGFWDTDLQGANAGRFLMGAGNTLRWTEHPTLRRMLDEVVTGVEECRSNSTPGYILAFPPAGFMHSEQGDYGRSWFTQGLIEAGKAGNGRAFPLLRGLYDWFNNRTANAFLPYLYDGVSNGEQGQIASTRLYLETPVGVWADTQVAQDAFRDDTWMRQLIAGDPKALSEYHMPAPNHPHCYEITAFLSMLDQYRATHNATWLAAAERAWELVSSDFLHVDGSSSLTEGTPTTDPGTGRPSDWPARSYHLRGTGETCCSVFWVKFCQRFQMLRPTEERYSAAIETAIYNALLRQMVPRASAGSHKGHNHTPRAPPEVPARVPAEHAARVAEAQETAQSTAGLPPGIRYHAPLEGVVEAPHNTNTCCEGQGTRLFGSLPEYLYSLGGAALYVNMYSASTLHVNVTVANGQGRVSSEEAPSPRPPTRRPSLPPPAAPPSFSWERVASGAFYPGAYCTAPVPGRPSAKTCPTNVSTLAQCQARCISSRHPAMCMGLTWREVSPAPPPPLCRHNCVMVPLPALNGTGAFHKGLYNQTQAAPVRSLAGCSAACLQDEACVQFTWSPRPADPCVLYQAIYDATEAIAGAEGFVKCAAGSTNASLCAHTVPEGGAGARCTLYQAVDTTRAPTRQAGVDHYLLHGRVLKERHDYLSDARRGAGGGFAARRDSRRPQAGGPPGDGGGGTVVAVAFTMATEFPLADAVSLRLDWNRSVAGASTIPFAVHLRMPSWLGNATKVVRVALNGSPLATGTPGTYLSLNRTWSSGDTVSFSLAKQGRLSPYTGAEQVPGYEGRRYAVQMGPVVLACVGPSNLQPKAVAILPVDPAARPESWLVPRASPLTYGVKGAPAYEFRPLWTVTDGEQFTTFPILNGSAP